MEKGTCACSFQIGCDGVILADSFRIDWPQQHAQVDVLPGHKALRLQAKVEGVTEAEGVRLATALANAICRQLVISYAASISRLGAPELQDVSFVPAHAAEQAPLRGRAAGSCKATGRLSATVSAAEAAQFAALVQQRLTASTAAAGARGQSVYLCSAALGAAVRFCR